ncbi:MAG TPA: asparaginase [Gaiellales bacterium]|nr:asparaginase [Gaiellales bacterium]
MAQDARIALFALGGTIAMTAAERGGVVPRLTGDDLVADLGDVPVAVEVKDAVPVPSAALTFSDVLDTVAAASRAVADGATGIVLAQGTDTLEETAFLIDSVWPHDAPFVVTGAMRNPTLRGADGPANLLAAVQVAAAPTARGRGVLVVFLDEIHAARHVRKTHSTNLATFRSPDLGPVGHVIEGTPRFLAQLPARAPITGWTPERVAGTRIALYTVTLDDDGALLEGPDHSHQGLVVAGYGAGHVPTKLLPALDEILQVMPVVLTSRSGSGPVLAATYGAPGAERDLLARGLISGRFVHPLKARVLLRLLVAAEAGRDEITDAFGGLG